MSAKSIVAEFDELAILLGLGQRSTIDNDETTAQIQTGFRPVREKRSAKARWVFLDCVTR
jgi:hypothetical protein